MRKITFLVLFLLIPFLKLAAQQEQLIVEKIWKGLGGKQNWDKARYLQFTFKVESNGKTVVSRNHTWDKFTGDYRYEFTGTDSAKNLVLFNVNTKKGISYKNNNQEDAANSLKNVDKAYATFINDVYWLAMPYKLKDEGVNLKAEEEETIAGTACHVLHLDFDKVGLTPGDQYWLYVNKNNGHIIQWKYLLQNQKETSIFSWAPYQSIGKNINLSLSKANEKAKVTISFPDTKILTKVPQQKFEKP